MAELLPDSDSDSDSDYADPLPVGSSGETVDLTIDSPALPKPENYAPLPKPENAAAAEAGAHRGRQRRAPPRRVPRGAGRPASRRPECSRAPRGGTVVVVVGVLGGAAAPVASLAA